MKDQKKIHFERPIPFFGISIPFFEISISKLAGPGQVHSDATGPGIGSGKGAEEGHPGLRIAVASWWAAILNGFGHAPES